MRVVVRSCPGLTKLSLKYCKLSHEVLLAIAASLMGIVDLAVGVCRETWR